jgi:raffinose/stachyose/melibiose transport system permease protein
VNKVLSNKKAILFFMFPAVFLFLLVLFMPVIMSVYYSTLNWDGLGSGTFIGVDNYKQLFFDNVDNFPKSVVNSFLFMLVSLFIQIPISLLFAIILANGVKGESFFRNVYFVPVVISTVVIGQLWMKIYNPDYGLLNIFLRSIGLGGWAHGWLGDQSTALVATFIPTLWQYVGYHMLLLYAAIKSISPEIFEAVKIDGANKLQTALHVTIPMIIPMLKVSLTFSVIGSLKVFDLVYVLTNGGPAQASEVPSTLMVRTIFLGYQYGYGSAMAVFIIAECIVFSVAIRAVFKLIERG